MIWTIKVGDIISIPDDIYYYEVTDIQKGWAVLENCLDHTYSEIMVSSLQESAKIIRRKD
jgi:hypothetical protein